MARLLKFRNAKSSSDRFETLMRPHFEALYRSARRFAANDADAEDLVQDVCIKAYLHFDEFERIEHPRAWLLRVLYYTFVDTRRSQNRAPTFIGKSIDQDDDLHLAENASLQPDAQADQIMRVERVLAAMALLDKELCTLLAMHDVDGLSIAELSVLTNLPQGTIKSRLFRTRAKLGRLLQNKQLGRVKLKVVSGG
ncbi:MAG: RNA polymerase sigma factor [Proteobacteria bacterium]|nr:RNA polymerase sigma factor [Pseudomonadota bacterium]